MIESKKVGKVSFKRFFIVIIILGIIVWAAFNYGFIKKNCAQNKQCFQDAAKTCKPSAYSAVKEGHLYNYEIKGSSGDNCKITITLKKMVIGTPRNLVDSFEGKNMDCLVPMSKTEYSGAEEIKDLLTYCSGPLKEAIYELIIQKLYGVLIKNLGGIMSQIQEQIFSQGITPTNLPIITNKTEINK